MNLEESCVKTRLFFLRAYFAQGYEGQAYLFIHMY